MEGICSLLSECKLEAVAHRRSELVRKVSESTSVSDAVTLLRENNILSIPVVDSKGQFVGVFSVTDLFCAMVRELRLNRSRASFDSNAITTVLPNIYKRPVTKLMHNGELWYVQGQDPSVLDAVKDMVLRGQVHHRLFTCETLKDTAPTGILSQSDIVQLMWHHKVELAPLLSKSVEDLGLCAAAAECVDAEDLLMDVLASMFNDHKSCMGVMHDGALVGNLSVSDLRAFTPDMHAHLLQPVGKFLLATKNLPVPQEKPINWSAALRAVPLHIVTPTTKFERVLELLAVNSLHRVYVLDSTEHSTGIITLTDILRQLLPKEPEAPMEGPAGGLPHSSEIPAEASFGASEGLDVPPATEVSAPEVVAH